MDPIGTLCKSTITLIHALWMVYVCIYVPVHLCVNAHMNTHNEEGQILLCILILRVCPCALRQAFIVP